MFCFNNQDSGVEVHVDRNISHCAKFSGKFLKVTKMTKENFANCHDVFSIVCQCLLSCHPSFCGTLSYLPAVSRQNRISLGDQVYSDKELNVATNAHLKSQAHKHTHAYTQTHTREDSHRNVSRTLPPKSY